jgi:hypothetical protein
MRWIDLVGEGESEMSPRDEGTSDPLDRAAGALGKIGRTPF